MVEIKNDCTVEVFDNDPPTERSKPLPYCSMGGSPQGIHSSGHFYRNKWYPDHCRVAALSLSDGLNCLKHKKVVILGDSTSRQMFLYLKDMYRGYFNLLPLPEGIEDKQGPLELVSTEYHSNIKYHFHGLPSSATGLLLRTDTIEFIANRLNSKRDGCDISYVICVWAHFVAPGSEFYIKRLLAIKRAVQAFLDRCPGSKVIIKGANTRKHPALWAAVISSEWNIVHNELSLRELFSDEKRIGFIDSLDITKAQPYDDNVHPDKAIVQEFVNRMLSYICTV